MFGRISLRNPPPETKKFPSGENKIGLTLLTFLLLITFINFQSFVLKILIIPPGHAIAIFLPQGLQEIHFIEIPILIILKRFPSLTRQILIVPSKPPEANQYPSGEKQILKTSLPSLWIRFQTNISEDGGLSLNK